MSKKKISIEDCYLRMQEECGIEVGDKVKVLRTAKEDEMGWGSVWAKRMDDFVGEVCEVMYIDNYGIGLLYNKDQYDFPFYVLEQTNKESSKVTDFDIGRLSASLQGYDFDIMLDGYYVCGINSTGSLCLYEGLAGLGLQTDDDSCIVVRK